MTLALDRHSRSWLASSSSMNLRNTIIYLIGIPAVGKYTIAKEIGRMAGAKVVDNQLINFVRKPDSNEGCE
jgi:hypothetical protein